MVLPHFDRLLDKGRVRGWKEGHETLAVSRAGLTAFLQDMLRSTPFDEEWYLQQYPDVAKAIAGGKVKSAHEHYIGFGYFEGRLPGLNGFDPKAYCESYDDLAPILSKKAANKLAKEHFIKHGYREGRIATGTTNSGK